MVPSEDWNPPFSGKLSRGASSADGVCAAELLPHHDLGFAVPWNVPKRSMHRSTTTASEDLKGRALLPFPKSNRSPHLERQDWGLEYPMPSEGRGWSHGVPAGWGHGAWSQDQLQSLLCISLRKEAGGGHARSRHELRRCSGCRDNSQHTPSSVTR